MVRFLEYLFFLTLSSPAEASIVHGAAPAPQPQRAISAAAQRADRAPLSRQDIQRLFQSATSQQVR